MKNVKKIIFLGLLVLLASCKNQAVDPSLLDPNGIQRYGYENNCTDVNNSWYSSEKIFSRTDSSRAGIVGSWKYTQKYDYQSETIRYMFNADGTFNYSFTETLRTNNSNAGGSSSYSGTYSLSRYNGELYVHMSRKYKGFDVTRHYRVYVCSDGLILKSVSIL